MSLALAMLLCAVGWAPGDCRQVCLVEDWDAYAVIAGDCVCFDTWDSVDTDIDTLCQNPSPPKA